MKAQLLVSTAVVMCLALAACSKKTETATNTPAGSATTTTTTTTAPPGSTTATTETPPSGDTGTMGQTTTAPSGEQSTASNETAPATGMAPGATSSTSDETTAQGFVQKAATGDLFEIQASKELLSKSGIDSKTRAFAQKMVTAHTDTSKQVKAIAGAENLTLPTSLDTEHQAMLDQLKGASGAAAVNLYLDQQTTAHQDALSLMQNCSANCNDTRLKQFAENTVPAVQQHLDDAKALKAAAPPSPNM